MSDRLSVWAPLAERVELFVGGERHPMARDERGWWTAALDLAAGTDYGFVLDDGSPIPGPRSPWQPDGVGAEPVTAQVDGVRRLAWPPELQTDAGRVHLPPDAVVVLERPG